ncbi:MAG: GntR family transcriptional regulator [Chloroflexota bacterium]|nr:GntR family transcriptional regulator [Chloroflexota bacterium]
MTTNVVPIPKYHRVKEALLDQMADGTLHPRAPIPSEAELCQQFGVSRITIRKAIGDLVHEGRLRTVQGKGTFMTDPKVGERFVQRSLGLYDEMERRGLRVTTQVLRQEIGPTPPEVASRLRLAPEGRVTILERLRSVAHEKLLLSTTYVPEALCPNLVGDDLSSGSLYGLLRTKYELHIARGEHSLEAVASGEREAGLLGIDAGNPLLLLDTVMYLANGTPLEYSSVLQRGDRVRVELDFLPASSGDTSPAVPRGTSRGEGGGPDGL